MWTLAGLRAPSLTDALRIIWQILPSVLIAAQFAADRAARALQCTGDGMHRHAAFIQGMQTVSF
ncbi:hypothetical protein BER92_03015 [Xanthomonas fragariae]|nr:hypothetical protein BER92_03015 [Xanthomonas fragariae]